MADRLQPRGVVARRQPRQHPGHDPLGQQVGRGERPVAAKLQLVLVGAGSAHPRPANPKPPPAQGDRARLAAMPHRGAGRIVLALGAGQLDDLAVHQLAHDLQADRGRGGQQPLGHVRGEHRQVLVHPTGQPLRQPSGTGRHQPKRAWVRRGLGGRSGSVGVLHAGSSFGLGGPRSVSRQPLRGGPHLKSHGPRDNLHRAASAGGGVLAGVGQRRHRLWPPGPPRLDPLSLGRPPTPPPMTTYWRTPLARN
jgi:hypothetical protein